MKPKIYVAGALTSAADLAQSRLLYETVAVHFEGRGWIVYVPHKHSDPVVHANLSAQAVGARNIRQIASSDLMIAEVTDPSHGVGSEIRVADNYGVPVILLHRRSESHLSRQLRSYHTIAAELPYDPENIEDLFERLDRAVEAINTPYISLLQSQEAFKRMLMLMICIIVRAIFGPSALESFSPP